MKIIEKRPRHRERCKNCNSVYDLEKGDVFCRETRDSDGIYKLAYPYVMLWDCPVCKHPHMAPYTDFPLEWSPSMKFISAIP